MYVDRAAERRAVNEERKAKARAKGLPWYVDLGGGRGRKSEPTMVMTVEDGVEVIAECDPHQARQIVEVVGALMQAREALQAHSAIDGPEFRAWQRANKALNAIFADINVPGGRGNGS